MKRILTASMIALAAIVFASCKNSSKKNGAAPAENDEPQMMYEKLKVAADYAGKGEIEPSDSIWNEIQEWERHADEVEIKEFRKLALGEE